jgi:hypothetical protein
LTDRAQPPTDAPPGAVFDAWRLAPLDRTQFAGLDHAARLAHLCALASLAPTTHNTVPQRFRLRPDAHAIELWLDRSWVLAASDVVGRQACVSLGCALANLRLAARMYGYATHVDIAAPSPEQLGPAMTGQPPLTPIATITLQASSDESDGIDWVGLALARKVVRAEYDERVQLPDAIADELARVVADVPGVELHLLRDAPTKLFLGKFQELADTTVLNRDAFALELGEWLLEDHDDNPRGMRGAEFGLSAHATQRFHLGLLRQLELLPDEIAGFAKAGSVGMRSASAIAVLTVDEDSLPRRLAAGALYQELALRLWRQRFCTAMHAGITEVDGPNLALRGRLRTRWRPTVVFRVGRPLHEQDWQRPHSSRPSLASLLINQPSP